MQGNSESQRKSLLEHWEEKWTNEAGGEELNVFFDFYKKVYNTVESKNESNKEDNYWYKSCFLIVLITGFVFYMWFLVYSFKRGEGSFVSLGFVLMAFIWLETIISKWLDIKKYQETWARHSWNLHMMKREMLYFISQIEPYGNVEDKRTFIKQIMEIWDKNQEKFVHNMEEKEKGLMDVFENIKLG